MEHSYILEALDGLWIYEEILSHSKTNFLSKTFFHNSRKVMNTHQWKLRFFNMSSNPPLFENFIDFCDAYFVMTKKVYNGDHKDTISEMKAKEPVRICFVDENLISQDHEVWRCLTTSHLCEEQGVFFFYAPPTWIERMSPNWERVVSRISCGKLCAPFRQRFTHSNGIISLNKVVMKQSL